MGQELVPFGLGSQHLPLETQDSPETPGVEGIFFTFPQEHLSDLASLMQRWFRRRPYVTIVDYGHMDKSGLGYIIMEWGGHEVDELLTDLFDDEERIVASTPYARDVED